MSWRDPNPFEQSVLEDVRERWPEIIPLARHLILAPRVEPLLLRNARRHFVPQAQAEVESLLWFSPLVAARSTREVVFHQGVARALADEWLQAPAGEEQQTKDKLDELWQFTWRHTRHWEPEERLERDLRYYALRDDQERLKQGLRDILRHIHRETAEQKRITWSRLGKRTLPVILPPGQGRPDEARLLAHYAALALGDAGNWAQPGEPQALPSWLASRLPAPIAQAVLGVEIRYDDRYGQVLHLVSPEEARDQIGFPSPLPARMYLAAEGRTGAWHTVAVGSRIRVSPPSRLLRLITLDGRQWDLRSEPLADIGTPESSAPQPLRLSFVEADRAQATAIAEWLGSQGIAVDLLPETATGMSTAEPSESTRLVRLWTRAASDYWAQRPAQEAGAITQGLLLRTETVDLPTIGTNPGQVLDWLDWPQLATSPHAARLLENLQRWRDRGEIKAESEPVPGGKLHQPASEQPVYSNMGSVWLRKPKNDASVVFVHGLSSGGETFWKHDNGAYWPGLLMSEPALETLGIYVYSYEIGIFTAPDSLADVVDDLNEHFFYLDKVADSRRIVFVCHSLGGIVVRKFLLEHAYNLLERKIEVGLFLVASPSLGSSYANWLVSLAKFTGHTQADALRFTQRNTWLQNLDKEFQNLKESGRLKIYGEELIEDNFVVMPGFWRKKVVAPFAGARYFADTYKVPGSDHSSIAKPDSKEAIQHRLLCQFIKEVFPKGQSKKERILKGSVMPIGAHDKSMPDKFLVAFSFAGEQRDLVRSIAEAVEQRLGYGKVFLDEWYEYYISGLEADLRLQNIYHKRSELVVFCMSKPSGNKPWTKVEFEVIRALKMQLSLSTAKSDLLRILPLRVGDGDVEGIFVNTICPDAREKPVAQTAELIINRLRLIRPDLDKGSASGEALSGPHRIYLAECTPDLEDFDKPINRPRIKAFLEELGYEVLPTTEYPAEQYPILLEQDLKECFAFVQLMGPYPWRRGGFDRIQNEAAATLGIPRFRYRSAEIDIEKVEPSQREFLTAPDVIASGFEDFKDHLAKKLTILAQQRERAIGARGDQDIRPLVVVAIRSRNPDRLWDRVFQWIYEQEGMSLYQLRPGETIEQSLVEPCHGFLIACDADALEDEATREVIEQCRRVQLREKNAARRPPVALVYWPPPLPSWAKLMRSIPLKLHRVLGDEPEKLSDFFAEVRKVAQ